MYSRKLGVFTTLVVSSCGALAIYLSLYAVMRPDVDLDGSVLLGLLGQSLLVVSTYLIFYRALALGPLAVVTPITSAFVTIVVLLSFVFLRERLSPIQSVGAIATIGGVLMASLRLGQLGEGQQRVGRGVLYAVGALLGFGFATFFSGLFARQLGYLLPAVITRSMITAMYLVTATTGKVRMAKGLSLATLGILAMLGIVDGLGFLAFSRGAEIGTISIVALISGAYPLVPLTLGMVIFKERLVLNQWIGVVGVFAGVAFLSWI